LADHVGGTTQANIQAAYAVSGGSVWGSGGLGNPLALTRLNNDGSLAAFFPGIPVTDGLWTNPVNGHLLGQGPAGVVDIDVSNPNHPTYQIIPSSAVGGHGVAVSPDGKIAYGTATDTTVQGFRISDGTVVYGPRPVQGSGGSDGIAVIGAGALKGDMLVNTNLGDLWLLDPNDPNSEILIAFGGTRGDYMAPDGGGGWFLPQSQEILRLTLGDTVAAVPEPSTWAMMLLGFAGLGLAGVKRTARRRWWSVLGRASQISRTNLAM
jgi:hypothetical protein